MLPRTPERTARSPLFLRVTGNSSAIHGIVKFEESPMSEVKDSMSKPRLSTDVYAVGLALILALLVRLNWLPAIKW
jgi:hypothetical protein